MAGITSEMIRIWSLLEYMEIPISSPMPMYCRDRMTSLLQAIPLHVSDETRPQGR